ncbi:hypothetical protein KJ671_04010 [Patescibacteria group bacterium]|nr:hypothetical protein [Patescibacteria group bacterium]
MVIFKGVSAKRDLVDIHNSLDDIYNAQKALRVKVQDLKIEIQVLKKRNQVLKKESQALKIENKALLKRNQDLSIMILEMTEVIKLCLEIIEFTSGLDKSINNNESISLSEHNDYKQGLRKIFKKYEKKLSWLKEITLTEQKE